MQSIEHTRILLVEDHHDLAETIADFLETMGCIVDYAADGLSGLHLARTQKFDVILLDVMLPGIDGLELARKLREQHSSSVPILMTTARDELNDKLAGFEAVLMTIWSNLSIYQSWLHAFILWYAELVAICRQT